VIQKSNPFHPAPVGHEPYLFGFVLGFFGSSDALVDVAGGIAHNHGKSEIDQATDSHWELGTASPRGTGVTG
jgi:hypothetical protein